jgi:hypothetical protein
VPRGTGQRSALPVADEHTGHERPEQLSGRDSGGEGGEPAVVFVGVCLARDHVLDAQREAEVAEPEQCIRGRDRANARDRAEQRAGERLERATGDEEGSRVSAVGEPAERDREEERQKRERGGHESDVARVATEAEQPVRGHRPRDVDGRLGRRHRADAEVEPRADHAASGAISSSTRSSGRPGSSSSRSASESGSG